MEKISWKKSANQKPWLFPQFFVISIKARVWIQKSIENLWSSLGFLFFLIFISAHGRPAPHVKPVIQIHLLKVNAPVPALLLVVNADPDPAQGQAFQTKYLKILYCLFKKGPKAVLRIRDI